MSREHSAEEFILKEQLNLGREQLTKDKCWLALASKTVINNAYSIIEINHLIPGHWNGIPFTGQPMVH